MKTSKRFLALMLSALMIFSVVFIPGVDMSMFGIEADAALGGITQQRVVGNYEALYRSYQKRFFGGEETNWPTNFVIPGLGSADDYTPQGMTYWKAKEWILISAYDASGSDASVIYALDVVTTNLVAVFKIKNADGTYNTGHGGGIAASKYNFYYADDASKVSYIPLSEMDVPVNTVKDITIKDSVDFSKELTGDGLTEAVKTSYCCYDDGVLWAGNFYYAKDTAYDAPFTNVGYPSALMGYKLAGNSSEEEWYYLKHGYNLVKLNTDSATEKQTSGTATYRTYNVGGANVEIRGNIATATALGEVTVNFCSVDLTAGKTYKVEYIADNNLTDMYFFAPGSGGHCNVKQSQKSTITDLGNGKYHYQMIFTAGLKPAGADSSWQTSTSVPSTYTGTYTMRFDQDSVPEGGREFNITDFSVSEYNNPTFTPDAKYEGIGCAGNPTYAIGLDFDKIQYAMVDKGKLYISRSWKRTWSDNHTRELLIADIDINSPGGVNYPINGRTRDVHLVNYNDANTLHFGGDNGQSSDQMNKMFYMGEALCVINDYLYMFGEGAAWNYAGKDSSNVCPEPIDVIWKIDQYAIQGLPRPHEDVTAVEYEKVNSLSEINSTDEYIIVHESPIKDPVTQDNILYLFDANGGYGDKKLPKKSNPSDITDSNTGDSIGMVGYEIRDYSVKEENGKISLILNAEDDANKSLHWQIESGSSTTLKLKNRDLYFAKHPYFYSGDSLIAMTTSADGGMRIEDKGNGNFCIKGGLYYNLWCNDGAVSKKITAYSNYYENHGKTAYTPVYHNLEEIAGTFHINENSNPTTATSEQTYFQIYKRVSDPYASTYETQVYTNLDAELTADGTYNVTLETYATNNLQYQRVANRPTDFIVVMDTSGSMDEQDAKTYYTESGWTDLHISSILSEDDTSKNGKGYTIYDRRTNEDIYFKTSDGVYHPVYASLKITDQGTFSCKQSYWVYYISKHDGLRYQLKPDGTVASTGWTYDQLVSFVSNNTNTSATADSNSNGTRRKTVVFRGPHYRYQTGPRISAVKNAVDSLTYRIAKMAAEDKLDHRMALVSFGSDGSYDNNYIWTGTGMYTNNGSWVSYPNITTTNYQNAFFSVSQFGTLRNKVNAITPLGHTFPSYGLDMASKIINNSAYKYDVNGTRSAVVIVISDGVPGNDNKQDKNLTKTLEIANSTLSNGAYSIKRSGAYVYSVLLGNATQDDYGFTDAQFDERDFMKYLSSEYTGARSMTDPGPFNTKEGVNYYMQVPTGSSFNLDNITNQIFNDSVANAPYATASLTGDAVLRERLSSAFDLSDATYTYQTAKSKYDGIGRLYFDTPTTATGIYADVLEETVADDSIERIVEVTGFDYSAKNVSEYNSKAGNGEKLIVTISGVVARHDRELNNTSINNTEETALYQNETFKNSDQPVKRFPTFHFSIPEYTYILDYGIGMYDNDINGTLLSVDSIPQKQDINAYKTTLNTDDMGIQFTNKNLDMIYSLKPETTGTEETSRGYCLIQRDDGTYDWFRINVLPASNVYFEEDSVTKPTNNGTYTAWTSATNSKSSFMQNLSTVNDVYGYDTAYKADGTGFSYNAAYTSTVAYRSEYLEGKGFAAVDNPNRSDTLSFTYTGDAVDLYGSCGKNTGIYIITIKNAETGSVEKVYILDTYFSDSTYYSDGEKINQVPILHHENSLRGTYKVEITSAYLSSVVGKRGAASPVSTFALDSDVTFYTRDITEQAKEAILVMAEMEDLLEEDIEVIFCDDNSVLNGGTGAGGESAISTFAGTDLDTSRDFTVLTNYFDGYRIYNPLDNFTVNEYYINSEKGSTYYSIIDSVVSAEDIINSTTSDLTGVAYVEKVIDPEYQPEDTINFANYEKTGPSDELYLINNKAVAFNVRLQNSESKVMISLRAVNGETKAKIGGKENAVTTSNGMYFDVTDYLDIDMTTGIATVTVENSGSNLLAIGDIKLCNAASIAPIMMASLPRIRMMMSAPAEEVEPNTPAEPENNLVIPDPLPIPEEPETEDGTNNNNSNDNSSDSDSIVNIFNDILAEIKSFFDMIIRFFKTLFA